MRRAVTMRDALADPRLLGNVLAGDSWATWRIFLVASMGEALSVEERAVFTKFTGRSREPGERIEEALFLVGRRGGKDRAAAVLAVYLAALVDWSSVLVRGERGLVICLGADQRQAKITRDYIEGAFDASPLLSRLIVGRTADAIELESGIAIEVRAASFRRLRGATCIAIVASEVAFWMSEESSNPDVEILNALRPSLATTGGPVIIITTPYARKGEVWNIHRRHYGEGGDPRILVAQAPSRAFNPKLSQKVIDRAMERDAAAASAEYLAEFRTDIESYVSRDVVEAAVVAGRHELPRIEGVYYTGFTDPSGGSGDSFALGVCHVESSISGASRAVVDAVRERRPPFSPDEVVSEYAALLKAYGISEVRGDRYAGMWPAERFAVHGISYVSAGKPKSDIYRDVLPILNGGRAELLDHPRLISQICALERRTARGGRDSIDHPPGQHDDVANCVAGAVVTALSVAAQRVPFCSPAIIGPDGVVLSAESEAKPRSAHAAWAKAYYGSGGGGDFAAIGGRTRRPMGF